MARLAGHVLLRIGGLEAPRGERVALAQIRRVALGALAVPVLRRLRPVQHVGVRHALARVQVEEALPAVLLRPAVPGDPERLQPSARQLQQVLLERRHAEQEGHLELGQLAVGPVGADAVASVALREGRDDALVLEAAPAEVSLHGPLVRLLHREVVVRAAPAPGLGRVARLAGAHAHVVERRRAHGRSLSGRRQHEHDAEREHHQDRGQQVEGAPSCRVRHGTELRVRVSASASGSRCRPCRRRPRPSAG